jgi:hypothetical protein
VSLVVEEEEEEIGLIKDLKRHGQLAGGAADLCVD